MASSRTARWIAAGALLVVAVWAYRHFGVGELLDLPTLQRSHARLLALVEQRPWQTAGTFFAVYVAATALSIPGALVLTLAAGAMFGFGTGLLIVSFASSLGALLAFLASRYLLRDLVQARLGRALAPIDAGLQRDGWLYLLSLRLVPAFPFWLVNLLMGLTSFGSARYYVVSQVGMLPGTAVFVNAGTQLASLRSAADILSPALWVSFGLLGLFPLVAKAAVGALQRRKVYARWPRPKRFDRNLVVIGAGAGGLVTAYIGAAVKARVTLVEGHRMGGDCLNTGCVPSKALIRSARLAHQIGRAGALGLHAGTPRVDFAAVMARVQRVVAAIEPHDSVERYTALGVEVLAGHATITSPWTVTVAQPDGTTRALTTKSIVVAAGARPAVPPIPGLADTGFLTSDTLWSLHELPRRLVVLGGGPVGCELAQAFARLGAQVTVVERLARVLAREDEDAAASVAAALQADGIELLTGHAALRAERDGASRRLVVRQGEAERALEFDALLCAVGRTPRVEGYGLEALGIELTPRGTIRTDAQLRTTIPNIYAVGDVAGPYPFTHAAAHQAWHAAVNALFGRWRRFGVDYSALPWVTFTDPEVARVGLSEAEARDQGVAFEVTRYGLDDLDRAIADDAAHGFVKVLTVPGRDRILGVTIVGEQAGELIAEYVLAMRHGLGLNKILGTVHAYPTLAEANKYAAGAWKRAHAPQRVLRWLERYHAWERR